ncbi:glutathione S-transferase [Tricladium varicosporioides]|nr:glutathione S-transferase [Hymenoscyphus varicosporioides]
MALTIHHLQVSQSERIPWLCEELNIFYNLVLHQRAPFLSPQSIKDINSLGQAPVIQVFDQEGKLELTLNESGACVEYIIHKYGKSQLALPPSHKNYADYLYWFHFANSGLQPHILTTMQISRFDTGSLGPGSYVAGLQDRLRRMLERMDERLGKNEYLAGDGEFSAADIMNVFSLTTMRCFYPFDLTPYPGILAWLERCTGREGYKKARAKADPELELMIEGKPPKSFRERLVEQGKL